MSVKITPSITNYKLITYTGNNNTLGTAQFDFNLVNGKRLLIKRIAFKWYTLDDSEGLPYLDSAATFDGTITGHNVIKSNTEKIYIPENSGSNINQDGYCTLIFSINNKPIYLNGKMDNIFLNEDNINVMISEQVQSIQVKVNGAKVALLNGSSIVTSENIGWKCEIGVYIL